MEIMNRLVDSFRAGFALNIDKGNGLIFGKTG